MADGGLTSVGANCFLLAMPTTHHTSTFMPHTCSHTQIKVAILAAMGALITRVPSRIKMFVPQMQSTFLKCLTDPERESHLKKKEAAAVSLSKVDDGEWCLTEFGGASQLAVPDPLMALLQMQTRCARAPPSTWATSAAWCPARTPWPTTSPCPRAPRRRRWEGIASCMPKLLVQLVCYVRWHTRTWKPCAPQLPHAPSALTHPTEPAELHLRRMFYRPQVRDAYLVALRGLLSSAGDRLSAPVLTSVGETLRDMSKLAGGCDMVACDMVACDMVVCDMVGETPGWWVVWRLCGLMVGLGRANIPQSLATLLQPMTSPSATPWPPAWVRTPSECAARCWGPSQASIAYI